MFGLGKKRQEPEPEKEADSPAIVRASIYSTDGQHLTGKTDQDRQAAIDKIIRKPTLSGRQAMDSSDGLVPDFKQMSRGEGVPDAQFFWYASQGFIGYQTAAIMSQHWLVDKACLVGGRDAVRVGYDVSLPDDTDRADEIIAAIKRQDKRYGINRSMVEYIHFGRVYGVRVAIFKVESTDPQYYEKPFNPDGVTPGSYRGIAQVDPIWIVPELSDASLKDPGSVRFYEPEFYVIGDQRYHRSHLCVYVPYPVPDALKPMYQYGGKSLPQMIYERVYASERTANEAPQLAMTKRLIVHKTDGATFFSNLTKSLTRMVDFIMVRDNYGVQIIDKDADEIDQHDTSLADLDTVIMTQYQLVASIAGTTSTKLLGTQPKGFNSSGEYEMENERIELESIQVNDLQPMLERHHQMTWLSAVKPELGIAEDIEIEVSWHPLDSPTAAEWADINLKKAQTAQAYAMLGAIDGEDIRDRLRHDKDSDFFGLPEDVVDLDLTDGEADGSQSEAQP